MTHCKQTVAISFWKYDKVIKNMHMRVICFEKWAPKISSTFIFPLTK
jgi:hypothetical protein